MKKKLLLGIIALFGYLLNATAGDHMDRMFKKYKNGKEQEIIYAQIDLQEELQNAKVGKAREDVNIDEVREALKMGLEKFEMLVCFRFGNMINSSEMPLDMNSEYTAKFIDDFAQLREKMLNDTKLSHVVLNKSSCNVDFFLPVSEASTVSDGYLFIKMINSSFNCLIHFSGKLRMDEVSKAITNGSFIGISGFEPTYTIVE